MNAASEPVDAETDIPDDQPRDRSALALRRPDLPVTLTELAALKGEALEIIDARVQVLATLRKAALRATNPEDWVLFKARDDQGGQVVGYLQDAGCERVRDLYGIEIFNVSDPEKVPGSQPGEFYYLIRGDGRCKFTRQTIESLEGGRSSTDDVCRGKSGAALELAVRKNARANLDGNVVRELAGLASVPLEELKAAWAGTGKDPSRCRLGRGFGSGVERQGQRAVQEGETREAPKCEICGVTAVFRPAGQTSTGRKYDAFWACPKSKSHEDKKWTLDDSKWRKQLDERAAAPTGSQAESQPSAPAERQPGEEG